MIIMPPNTLLRLPKFIHFTITPLELNMSEGARENYDPGPALAFAALHVGVNNPYIYGND